MDHKPLFILGAKWLGVYCLVLAIGELFSNFPASFFREAPLENTTAIFKLLPWMSLVIPALLLAFGLYLMKDGSYVHDLVFRRENGVTFRKSEGLFTVGIMLYGIYLVAGSMADVLHLLSNALFILNRPPYLSTEAEMEGLRSDLLPTLWVTALGFYCFFRGRDFVRLAFRRI